MGFELAELGFPAEIGSLAPSAAVRHGGYEIVAYETNHPGGANGYVLREDERPGQFFPERARELGVPEGPLYGRLQRGEVIRTPAGREVAPGEVMGPPRPGRTLVYTGDTRPSAATAEAANGCDLLIHEATFSEEEADRAERTGHSTARQAAEVARRAAARRLILTHLSARYSERPQLLEREARRACGPECEVAVAYDGMTVELALSDSRGGGQLEARG